MKIYGKLGSYDQEARDLLCGRCGKPAYRRYLYLPRSVVRVRILRAPETHRYVKWVCKFCLNAVTFMDSHPTFFEDFARFLGHRILELRVIDTDKGQVVFQDYNIQDPEIFAQKCREFSGKAQVYFGVQARDGEGASYENVPALSWIALDIDAVRPDKKTKPANEEQRENALRNAAKIIRELKGRGVDPGLWTDTGNGSLILYRVPTMETGPHFYKTGDSTQNKLSDKVNFWLQNWVKPLCDDTVEVDSVGDLPRILGVPNTVNLKSPGDQPRLRTILYPVGGDITKPAQPQPLWNLIEECWTLRKTTVAPAKQTPSTMIEALPPYLEDLYQNLDATADRSLILIRTLLYLANNLAYTKDECVSAMGLFTEKLGRKKWPAAQQFDKLLAEGKIHPSAFSLDKYLLRVRGKTAIVYEGDQAIYPLNVRELKSAPARSALAKSLKVDKTEIDRVAAAIVHFQIEKEKEATKEAGSKAEPQRPSEVTEKAEQILTSGDPIEFVADLVQRIHYGDRQKSKIVWLGVITTELGHALPIIVVGVTGVGKSDLVYAVLCCVPEEYVVRLKECSPKAVYYAVNAGVNLDNATIYFDDVPDSPEHVKLLKDLMSESRANPRLWSVTVQREFLDAELKGDFVIFASAISNLTDEGGQIIRRYVVLNPDENPEVNKKVLDKIKTDMRLGRGKRWLPSEFEVAKEVTRLIKEADYEVHVPFDFKYPEYGTMARSELKQFGALFRAVVKARFKQRLTVGKILLAQPEDFETAVELWGERQSAKIDELAIKVLAQLGDEEPEELVDDDGKKTGLFSPKPMTSTVIAKELKEKPRAIRDKLRHLYDIGYVDRKAVGGRGNPHGYWKSPALSGVSETPESLSPSLPENLISGINDYYGQIGSQYKELDPNAEKTWSEYLERVKKHCGTVTEKSRHNNLSMKTGLAQEKEPANLGVSKTPESLGVSRIKRMRGQTNLLPAREQPPVTERPEAIGNCVLCDQPILQGHSYTYHLGTLVHLSCKRSRKKELQLKKEVRDPEVRNPRTEPSDDLRARVDLSKVTKIRTIKEVFEND